MLLVSPFDKVLEGCLVLHLLGLGSASHFFALSWTQVDKPAVVLPLICPVVVHLRGGLEPTEVTDCIRLTWCFRLLELSLPLRLLLLLELWLPEATELLLLSHLLLHVHLLLLHLAIEELRSETTSILLRLLHLLLLLHHVHLLHLHELLLLILLLSHPVLLAVEAAHCVKSMVLVVRWRSVRVLIVHIHHVCDVVLSLRRLLWLLHLLSEHWLVLLHHGLLL